MLLSRRHQMQIPAAWLLAVAVAVLGADRLAGAPAVLEVVGVLGNTSGLSHRPVPYAFYTGIGLDARERIYLAGAVEGVPLCNSDGQCLNVLTLPEAEGLASRSLITRAGDFLFLAAMDGQRSQLYRIDTRSDDPAAVRTERVAGGPGHWALSTTLDGKGRLVVGQSDTGKLRYRLAVFEPGSGIGKVLFELPMPTGATAPWRHLVQVEPDDTISITHLGGVNWSGRYSAAGRRIGEANAGQRLDEFRYQFGYEGGLRRTTGNGQAAPGECGSPAAEIRMAGQVVRCQER